MNQLAPASADQLQSDELEPDGTAVHPLRLALNESQWDQIELTFDNPDGKGRVILHRSEYGIYLSFPDYGNGHSEAMVDFFPRSMTIGPQVMPSAEQCRIRIWDDIDQEETLCHRLKHSHNLEPNEEEPDALQ